jgi:hypothetical protein
VYWKLGYRCNLALSKCGSLVAQATDANKGSGYMKPNAEGNSYGRVIGEGFYYSALVIISIKFKEVN